MLLRAWLVVLLLSPVAHAQTTQATQTMQTMQTTQVAASGEAASSVEAPQPRPQPYVQGRGRGFFYGSALLVPLYVSDLRSTVGSAPDPAVYVGPGVGVRARLGWELPLGFTIDVMGGLAVSGVDTRGMPGRDDLFVRYDVAAGARYHWLNGSAFVPFGGLAFTLHFWRFAGPAPAGGMPVQVDTEVTVGANAVLGLHLELAPWVGLEGSVEVDVTNGGGAFRDALVWVTPSLGVTMYAY